MTRGQAKLRFAALAVAATSVLTACTGAESTTNPTAPAATTSSLPSASASPELELEDQVVIRTTGGVFGESLRANFFDAFTEETGVEVIEFAGSLSESWAKIEADAASGNQEIDVMAFQPSDLIERRDLLVDLGGSTCSLVPSAEAQGLPGTCRERGITQLVGGGILAYDTTAFADAPTSWADFWDTERFPGPRALYGGDPVWLLMVALFADGVPPEDLFPLDVERGFAKLDEIRPEVSVFWESGDQSQQLWRDGEVVMAMMFSGRAYALQNEGLPVGIVWDGAPADIGTWGIVADSPHPNAALAFLDFYMTRPEAHAAFTRELGYATPHKDAASELSAADQERFDTTGVVEPDWAWVAENKASLTEQLNAWLAGG